MRARRKEMYGTAPSYHFLGTVEDNSREGFGFINAAGMDCEKKRSYT